MDLIRDIGVRYSEYLWIPFVAMRGSLHILSTLVSPFTSEREVGAVSELYIHPIRALRPVKMRFWNVEKYGLFMDKRMCLFEEDGTRIKHTQPGSEILYLIDVSLPEPYNKVILSYKDKPQLIIDCTQLDQIPEVETDRKGFQYKHVGDRCSTWFSELLGRKVRLMFSPYKSQNDCYSIPPSVDPVLIIGESSLKALSRAAGWAVEMERFRPNIVSSYHPPYADEQWDEIKIGEVVLTFDHRCTRCLITNVTCNGVRNSATMDTLKKHRPKCEKTNKPVFGSYFNVTKPGVIRRGDKIVLVRSR